MSTKSKAFPIILGVIVMLVFSACQQVAPTQQPAMPIMNGWKTTVWIYRPPFDRISSRICWEFHRRQRLDISTAGGDPGALHLPPAPRHGRDRGPRGEPGRADLHDPRHPFRLSFFRRSFCSLSQLT